MEAKPYYDKGVYKCQVMEQGFNEASTGTAQFWLKFLVLERIEPFHDGIKQFSRTAYFPITEKTADWLMHDLQALGYTGQTFDGLDPRLPNHHSFVRNEIELRCKHEEDQDKNQRERWSLGGAPRLLESDKVHRLNRFLTKKPPVTNSHAQADSTVITDDDVPF